MRFKGSVSYRFGDGTNVYLTRSEGYRIGGGNNFRVCTDEEIALLTDADPSNDPPQSGCIYADQALIEPDTTTNYEIGLRRSWGADRVALGASLFHVDWRDIQVAGLTPFSAQGITLNGGAAVSRGVEIAASAGLTAALRLRGSWSYTRAALSQDSPGLLDDGADAFEGDRLAGAPRSQGSLFASYGTLLGDDVALELLLRLQLHRRRPDPYRGPSRRGAPPGVRPPYGDSVGVEGRVDADRLRRQPVRRIRRHQRASDARAHRPHRGRLHFAAVLRQRAYPAAGGCPAPLHPPLVVGGSGRDPPSATRSQPHERPAVPQFHAA